ncbi:DUF6625 family protein [Phocaeicola plebeius]|jgi:hypothetical protein|uniref:DUF6625 family protein n=1 Tax=Phocaeicola plebeius TaxID=310297 RepID=UPI003F7F9107
MKKKRLCFIIPYFGKLPNHFPVFLKTCEANPNYNWLIFTDDTYNYNYPPNVQKIKMTFEECKKLIQSKFDCQINILKPYKLCDLKPMYGYIFEEYLEDYRFWGHCDVDTIMGNLSKWLTDEFLEQYDKIFQLGHMTIYKNTAANNRIFMNKFNGDYPYKSVLKNSQIMWFDEEWNNSSNINRLFIAADKRLFKEDLSLNVSYSYNPFVKGTFIGTEHTAAPYGFEIEKRKKAIYIWEKTDLYRLFLENGKIIKESYLYMHFQLRPMKYNKQILNQDCFEIIPDEFRPYNYPPLTPQNIQTFSKSCKSHIVQKRLWQRVIKYFRKKFHINEIR